jgi:membrane protease YdiL (CAAX protease family)
MARPVALGEVTLPLPADPSPDPERGRTPPRGHAVLAMALLLLALAGFNVAMHLLPAGTVWLSLVAAPALLAFGRLNGLSWAQLGLDRRRLRAGSCWGLGAIGVVGIVYLVGILVPVTRPAFLDARYHLAEDRALITALLVIPIGTILLEEVAFRSVLWGMLHRHMRTTKVLLVSSVLFGLWHVFPALGDARRGAVAGVHAHAGPWTTLLVVAGTVAFTAIGGVVAGELRRRSGSVLASAGMHWATNGLGVLFGLLAWQLAR